MRHKRLGKDTLLMFKLLGFRVLAFGPKPCGTLNLVLCFFVLGVTGLSISHKERVVSCT